jgi:lauroyl/myristoyl acyltransferase
VNAHLITDAIARGRGAVFISAHYGAWEIAGLALMALVPNVLTVARPLDNELLERDLVRIRALTGAEVVDRQKAARPLLKTLQQKGGIVILPDQAVQSPFWAVPRGRPTPLRKWLCVRSQRLCSVFAFRAQPGIDWSLKNPSGSINWIATRRTPRR